MPEPLSTVLSLCLGYVVLNGYRRNDSSVSPEGNYVAAGVRKVIKSAEDSQALFGAKSAALSELQHLADECASDDWDGNGALGVDLCAFWNAQDFVRALPDEFPLPEFAAEPDGSISLDWIRSRHQLFSLSVGTSNRLAYAWLDGTNKGHGVDQFDGITVPPRLLSQIQSILNNGKLTIRIA